MPTPEITRCLMEVLPPKHGNNPLGITSGIQFDTPLDQDGLFDTRWLVLNPNLNRDTPFRESDIPKRNVCGKTTWIVADIGTGKSALLKRLRKKTKAPECNYLNFRLDSDICRQLNAVDPLYPIFVDSVDSLSPEKRKDLFAVIQEMVNDKRVTCYVASRPFIGIDEFTAGQTCLRLLPLSRYGVTRLLQSAEGWSGKTFSDLKSLGLGSFAPVPMLLLLLTRKIPNPEILSGKSPTEVIRELIINFYRSTDNQCCTSENLFNMLEQLSLSLFLSRAETFSIEKDVIFQNSTPLYIRDIPVFQKTNDKSLESIICCGLFTQIAENVYYPTSTILNSFLLACAFTKYIPTFERQVEQLTLTEEKRVPWAHLRTATFLALLPSLTQQPWENFLRQYAPEAIFLAPPKTIYDEHNIGDLIDTLVERSSEWCEKNYFENIAFNLKKLTALPGAAEYITRKFPSLPKNLPEHKKHFIIDLLDCIKNHSKHPMSRKTQTLKEKKRDLPNDPCRDIDNSQYEYLKSLQNISDLSELSNINPEEFVSALEAFPATGRSVIESMVKRNTEHPLVPLFRQIYECDLELFIRITHWFQNNFPFQNTPMSHEETESEAILSVYYNLCPYVSNLPLISDRPNAREWAELLRADDPTYPCRPELIDIANEHDDNCRFRQSALPPNEIAKILNNEHAVTNTHELFLHVRHLIKDDYQHFLRISTNPRVKDLHKTEKTEKSKKPHSLKKEQYCMGHLQSYLELSNLKKEDGYTIVSEFHQQESLGPGSPGRRPDLLIRRQLGKQQFNLYIEGKVSSNREVISGLKCQLFDKYMKHDGTHAGLYVVFWVPSNKYPTIADLQNALDNEASQCRSDRYFIDAIVIDASLRSTVPD